MARGRMLSRDISLDEKVNALSGDTARLLFTWMIPHLDTEGRLHGDAQAFRAIVTPRRNYSIKKVEKILQELEKFGLIHRYTVNGNQYLFAPNFEKHQTGLRKDREAQSKIPLPPPELLRSNDGVSPAQVKDKFKLKSNTTTNNDLDFVFTFINENFHKPVTKYIRSKVSEFSQIYPPDWLMEALKTAVERGKPNIGYTEGILRDWQARGFKAPPPEPVKRKQGKKPMPGIPKKWPGQDKVSIFTGSTGKEIGFGRV